MILTLPQPRSATSFSAATTGASAPSTTTTGRWATYPGGVVDGGEIVLLAVKPSLWRPVFDSSAWILFSVFAAATALIMRLTLPGLSPILTAEVLLLIGAARLGAALVFWIPTWHLLTNRRILNLRGVRTPHVSSCPLLEVRNTYIHRSFPEHHLSLGTILFVTDRAGDPHLFWRSIADPDAVHDRIRRAIENAIDQQHPVA